MLVDTFFILFTSDYVLFFSQIGIYLLKVILVIKLHIFHILFNIQQCELYAVIFRFYVNIPNFPFDLQGECEDPICRTH